jgi:hypothetical protein
MRAAAAIKKMVQWNDDTLAFMRSKLEPAVKAGKLNRQMADTLPDVLSAFIDGICVRLVLDDESSVTALSKNIERFLCRIVDG